MQSCETRAEICKNVSTILRYLLQLRCILCTNIVTRHSGPWYTFTSIAFDFLLVYSQNLISKWIQYFSQKIPSGKVLAPESRRDSAASWASQVIATHTQPFRRTDDDPVSTRGATPLPSHCRNRRNQIFGFLVIWVSQYRQLRQWGCRSFLPLFLLKTLFLRHHGKEPRPKDIDTCSVSYNVFFKFHKVSLKHISKWDNCLSIKDKSQGSPWQSNSASSRFGGVSYAACLFSRQPLQSTKYAQHTSATH